MTHHKTSCLSVDDHTRALRAREPKGALTMSGDFPTHDEIEAMRGGGFVPDPLVDAIHRERDRFDEAHERMLRFLTRPIGPGGTVTIPVVTGDENPCPPPTATTGAPAAATSPRTGATGASGAEVGE